FRSRNRQAAHSPNWRLPPARDRNSMRTPRLSPLDGARYIRRAIMASLKRSVIKVCGGRHHMVLKIAVLIAVLGLVPECVSAQSKQEFKMSVVGAEDTAGGRAAKRFADALRHRTQARINVTNYFDGKLFADRQTTEFHLLQQGAADFAIGSPNHCFPK